MNKKEETTIAPCRGIKRTISDIESPPASPKAAPRRCCKKSVCIVETSNRVHKIEPTGKDDCWLQDNDYDNIRRDTRATLREIIMLRGRVSMMNEDKFCARGLEGSIAKLFGNESYHMSSKFQTVLLRRQANDRKKHGSVDPIALSQISVRHSKHDRTRAVRLAQFDATLS